MAITNISGRARTGTSGKDTMNGGNADDVFIGSADADTINGSGGIDLVDYSKSPEGVTINLMVPTQAGGGDAKGDVLFDIENVTGSGEADTLRGNSGINTLRGGDGNDTLTGGIDGQVDWLYGGADTDTVDYSAGNSAMTITLGEGDLAGQGVVNAGFTFNPATNSLSGSLFDTVEDMLFNIENVVGSQASDTIRGNSAVNRLDGGAGNDWLSGLGGGDTLIGGEGQDTADYRASSAAVQVDLTGVTQRGGHAEGDTLVSIENVQGSLLGDTLTGDANGNVLDGGGGDDVLKGGAGQDVLRGGTGDDLAYLDIDGQVDHYDGGAGIDTLGSVGRGFGLWRQRHFRRRGRAGIRFDDAFAELHESSRRDDTDVRGERDWDGS